MKINPRSSIKPILLRGYQPSRVDFPPELFLEQNLLTFTKERPNSHGKGCYRKFEPCCGGRTFLALNRKLSPFLGNFKESCKAQNRAGRLGLRDYPYSPFLTPFGRGKEKYYSNGRPQGSKKVVPTRGADIGERRDDPKRDQTASLNTCQGATIAPFNRTEQDPRLLGRHLQSHKAVRGLSHDARVVLVRPVPAKASHPPQITSNNNPREGFSMFLSPWLWLQCDICDKLMPFKRYFVKPGLNYLECPGCGQSIAEKEEQTA